MKSYKSFLNERRTIQVKRKYGKYASTVVGANAPVRQKILGFVSEQGSCCKTDLMEYIKSANEESGRKTSPQWIKKNSRYLVTFEKNGETHYKLSKLGKRVINATNINESNNDYVEEIGDLEELIYDQGDMRTTAKWDDESEVLLQGNITWAELDVTDLRNAIDMARDFMRKHKIKESLVVENAAQAAKDFADLRALIKDDADGEHIYSMIMKDDSKKIRTLTKDLRALYNKLYRYMNMSEESGVNEGNTIDSPYLQRQLEFTIKDIEKDEPDVASVLNDLSSRLDQSYPQGDVDMKIISSILKEPNIKKDYAKVSGDVDFYLSQALN